MRRDGFTLVEILVVIAISVMLTGIAFTYTNVARNEVALSVETSKIAGIVLQAKDLAIATYNQASTTCAYGVSINIAANEYSVFAFNPDPSKYGSGVTIPPCPTVASTTAAGVTSTEMAPYTQSTWNVHVTNGVHLASGGAGDDLAVVVFYPPAPTTLISRDGENFLSPPLTSQIYLVTADGKSSSAISVNSVGQVSF